MSDTVTKWHEMNDEPKVTYGNSISDQDRSDAYKILAYYNEDSIRLAAKILDLE